MADFSEINERIGSNKASTLTCQIIVQQILLFFGEKEPTQPY